MRDLHPRVIAAHGVRSGAVFARGAAADVGGMARRRRSMSRREGGERAAAGHTSVRTEAQALQNAPAT